MMLDHVKAHPYKLTDRTQVAPFLTIFAWKSPGDTTIKTRYKSEVLGYHEVETDDICSVLRESGLPVHDWQDYTAADLLPLIYECATDPVRAS